MHPRAEKNLVDVILSHAGRIGAKEATSFRDDRDQDAGRYTYVELDRAARAIGALLQGYRQHQRPVLLCLDAGPHFVASFLGCLYAGAIAVPATVGLHPRYIERLRRVVADCRPAVGLTTAAIAAVMKGLTHVPEISELVWLTVDELPAGIDGLWKRPEIAPDWLTFLQYTSGSTGHPKGVMVSHENLTTNLVQIEERFGLTEAERLMFWLPPFHDMGLIGGILAPLHRGASTLLCPPGWFARQPGRWLERMSTERYTVSGAPNFAYELCLRQSVPSDGLDLSGWELAFCGAEPIRASTVERFTAKLAPHGFQPRAFYACYGLAEATLLVTANARGSGATITAVDRAQQRRDVVAPTSDQDELRLVACGGPVDGMELLIVDPAERRALPSGSVGEIWLRGANVAVGYWRRPEETARDFGATLATAPPGGVTGPYLRTGDRGVVIDGQLYVAGRIKDMMIFHGQNHYPQDIEETVDRCHKALRAGCGAAFSVQHDGEERLVVVYELVEGAEATPDISTAVARAIWEDHGIPLFALSLIRKSTVPKTSSGKIMRSATRAAFQGGTLSAVASWTDLKEQR